MVGGMYGLLHGRTNPDANVYSFPSCQAYISNNGNVTGTAGAGAGAGRLRWIFTIMTVVGALHKLQKHIS